MAITVKGREAAQLCVVQTPLARLQGLNGQVAAVWRVGHDHQARWAAANVRELANHVDVDNRSRAEWAAALDKANAIIAELRAEIVSLRATLPAPVEKPAPKIVTRTDDPRRMEWG